MAIIYLFSILWFILQNGTTRNLSLKLVRKFSLAHGLYTERGCTLNFPPFSKGKPLSRKQVTKTRRIASSRIHVERGIERLKKILFSAKGDSSKL